MNNKPATIAISDNEFRLHRKPRFLRRFFHGQYPRNIHSGKPITEFVALADQCARRGVLVVPHSRVEEFLRRGEPILKFGKTNLAGDLALLKRHPNPGSEWNQRNLETISEYNHFLNLGRKTWNLFLSAPEHQDKLRELFRQHGRLFVKSLHKGHSKVCSSYENLMAELGDLSRLSSESVEIFVSEVINIRQIEAETPEGRKLLPDEWRHYVYRQRLIASGHAFDCDSDRADNSGQPANYVKARATIDELRQTDFATTYVLDTCSLGDATAAVIETNSFFASGIYSRAAIQAIAEAIVGG